MAPGARVLLIGLDSADPVVVRQLVAAGRMPAVASVLASGAWCEVEAPPGVYTAAIWPSIATGLSPAGHGRYCDEQLVVGTYRCCHFGPTDMGGKPFWESLSEAGYRVAIVDVPHTALSKELNGIHVMGWGGCAADQEFGTWPPSYARDLRERWGSHPVGWDCGRGGDGASEWARLRDKLVTAVQARAAMAGSILSSEAWDFVFYVFSEAHCAGHNCWHLHDPSHPRYMSQLAATVGPDPVAAVYEELDRAIGTIIEQAGRDAICGLLLSHGMGPNYTGNHLLDQVLARFEDRSTGPAQRLAQEFRATAWRGLPPPARRAARLVRRSVFPHRDPLVLNDRRLASREAFALRQNTCGAVRVNLSSREPNGRVSPENYDEYCTELSNELLELVNVGTGRPVVHRVIKSADIFIGARLDGLPDLVVEWDASEPITEVTSPRIGTVKGDNPDHRSGDHRPTGLLVVTGPGTRPGYLGAPIQATDIAPTIASLFGVRLPASDGRVFSLVAGPTVAPSG